MPARLRTAVLARDATCVVPGCEVRRGLQIDHVVPLSEHGPTRLDNLARRCSWHHYLKTHQGWRLSGGPGSWEWRGPEHASPTGTAPARAVPLDRRRAPAPRLAVPNGSSTSTACLTPSGIRSGGALASGGGIRCGRGIRFGGAALDMAT
jgi:hypothetical protein